MPFLSEPGTDRTHVRPDSGPALRKDQARNHAPSGRTGVLAPAGLLALQCSAGTAAVAAMMASGQPSQSVSPPVPARRPAEVEIAAQTEREHERADVQRVQPESPVSTQAPDRIGAGVQANEPDSRALMRVGSDSVA